jgi:hypothetical protein
MDDYSTLKELLQREEKSFGQFLREIINQARDEYDGAYYHGYNVGMMDWRSWYFCSICGERIDIIPDGNSHKALIEYMKEHGWGHSSCHNK